MPRKRSAAKSSHARRNRGGPPRVRVPLPLPAPRLLSPTFNKARGRPVEENGGRRTQIERNRHSVALPLANSAFGRGPSVKRALVSFASVLINSQPTPTLTPLDYT
ncbi:unnamed protein product [Pieris brassicae]|uniref:Uncharacterized protein n=1 Tax=Pieris brassicae TaxID=7116 RepID=A0A9P0T7Q6_PIEBR|nr:unnamed protein product [Pieris brassicae]